MAYSEFLKIETAVKDLQLILDERTDLFIATEEVAPSEGLRALLEEHVPLALALNTEKARSEMIIAPVLWELRKQRPIGLFSGVEFNVDQSKGLNGVCDFLLSRDPEQFFVRAPVAAIVEAKNEDFKRGLAQCAAEMVAARMFNEREGSQMPAIYGAVTTGNLWKFLRLRSDRLSIDRREYHIDRIAKILGILLAIVSEDRE